MPYKGRVMTLLAVRAACFGGQSEKFVEAHGGVEPRDNFPIYGQ